MYKCENCGAVVSSKTPAIRVPVEFRRKTYFPEQEKPLKTKKKKYGYQAKPATSGYEIVREMTVCENCVRTVKQTPPNEETLKKTSLEA